MLTRRLPLIAITAIISSILFINIPTTQATDCAATVTTANNNHKQALKEHQPGTDSLLTALYKIEDALFDAMKSNCADNSAVVSTMGELQLSLGQIPIAQLYAIKALEMDSKNWQAHYVLGSALNLNKKYAEGLEHLQRASQLQPDNYSLLVNLCSSYEKNKQYPEAINACSTAIEKGPYGIRGTAYFIRAQAYKGNNEITLAERDIELAKEFGFKQ